MKLEVETVIKTGRQIVQKQQTDNPKGMDEQLTALKFLYNDLGAQVRKLNLYINIYLHINYFIYCFDVRWRCKVLILQLILHKPFDTA